MTETKTFIVNAIKIGNTVNISINGKLTKKNCGSPKEADELFRLCLTAKEKPSVETIKLIKMALNEKTRIAMLCGLEADNDTGEVYLAGFNTPVPISLIEIIKEYHENKYPLTAIINFWKLLMINPDPRVRKSLFDFIMVHDFVITDSGYFIAYKAVEKKKLTASKSVDTDLAAFVKTEYDLVKNTWKMNPARYMVYKKLNEQGFYKTKNTTCAKWDEKAKEIQFLGKLDTLYNDVQNLPVAETVQTYTDKYSHKMHIQLGIPAMQKRGACDANPGTECSKGLHVGATRYIHQWYKPAADTAVLICYVNPANVIAVPDHDKTKIRVCEYFPYAETNFVDGKLTVIKESYHESDYKTYEEKELAKMVTKLQANQLPIEKAINVPEDEMRPMADLLAIIQNRIVSLNV